MSTKNYNKPKYILIVCITLVCIMAVMGIAWLIMAFASPYTFAGFAYKMGWHNYAHTLYIRSYNRDQDINAIYRAYNISVKLGNDDQVMREYVLLTDNTKYVTLVDKINADNMNLSIDNFTKSTLINEDEYIKSHYVKSLVNTGNIDDAMLFASTNMPDSVTLTNLGNYLYNYIVPSGRLDNAKLATIKDTISDYFDKLYDVFGTIDLMDNYYEVYNFALCNKMMKVGNNLIAVLDRLSEPGKEAITDRLTDVSNAVQTMLDK